MLDIWFFIAFLIWVLSSLVRNIYERRKYSGSGLSESGGALRIVMFAMFLMWFSWFFMTFADPVKLTISTWQRYVGLAVFSVGVILFVISETTKGGVSDTGSLVTKGIYSKIRHPMYLGQIMMAVGFPIYTRGLVTLCLSAVWVAQILYWRHLEEKDLIGRFEEYGEYRKRTWF